MTLQWCKYCPLEIKVISERPGKTLLKKRYDDHFHFGTRILQYGMCDKSHCTMLRKDRIEWKPCKKCQEKKEEIKKIRRHLKAKARMQERKIPSFLRDELDRFKAKMERKIQQELQKRVEQEVHKHMDQIVENRSYTYLPVSRDQRTSTDQKIRTKDWLDLRSTSPSPPPPPSEDIPNSSDIGDSDDWTVDESFL